MARIDKRTSRQSLVVRIDEDVQSNLTTYREKYGSWNKAIKQIVAEMHSKISWSLPSDIYNTEAQARGEALKRSVISGVNSETPIPVRPIDETD